MAPCPLPFLGYMGCTNRPLKRMLWRAGMAAQDIVLGGSIRVSHQNSLSADSAESGHSSSLTDVRLFSLVSRVFCPAWWCCYLVTSHAHARLFRLWSPTIKRAFAFSTASQHDSGIVVGHELLLSNAFFASISLHLLPSMVMVGTHRARVSL